jgi:hypothetical protein
VGGSQALLIGVDLDIHPTSAFIKEMDIREQYRLRVVGFGDMPACQVQDIFRCQGRSDQPIAPLAIIHLSAHRDLFHRAAIQVGFHRDLLHLQTGVGGVRDPLGDALRNNLGPHPRIILGLNLIPAFQQPVDLRHAAAGVDSYDRLLPFVFIQVQDMLIRLQQGLQGAVQLDGAVKRPLDHDFFVLGVPTT